MSNVNEYIEQLKQRIKALNSGIFFLENQKNTRLPGLFKSHAKHLSELKADLERELAEAEKAARVVSHRELTEDEIEYGKTLEAEAAKAILGKKLITALQGLVDIGLYPRLSVLNKGDEIFIENTIGGESNTFSVYDDDPENLTTTEGPLFKAVAVFLEVVETDNDQ